MPDSSAFRSQLLAALALLSPVRREVVLLHDLEGWTHPQIADALELSELMSRQHLFLARRELRERLEHEVSEVDDA
jgi:RNA polymerase sigma-70 factor (ECF subfamily)